MVVEVVEVIVFVFFIYIYICICTYQVLGVGRIKSWSVTLFNRTSLGNGNALRNGLVAQ